MTVASRVVVVLHSRFSVDDRAIESELLSLSPAKMIAIRFAQIHTLLLDVVAGQEQAYADSASRKKFVLDAYPERKFMPNGSEHPVYSHIANHWIADEYRLWITFLQSCSVLSAPIILARDPQSGMRTSISTKRV